jgi:hypothetical protein
MASLKELAQQKVKLFAQSPERLALTSEKVQLELWKQILPIINEFETDAEGNILQTDANIRRIGQVITTLNELLAGDEYVTAVKSFLGDIDKGLLITDEIAKTIKATFEPSEALKSLQRIIKQNAIDSFIGDGLRARVTQPFVQQLTANIAARAPLRDAVKALEVVIIGDDKTDGRLLANVKTVATTSQAVSDRSYSASIYEQLGIEWFEYVGGEIDTTRPFCMHREGNIYHKKEIESWGAGKNSGGLDDIKRGTWDGRIDGTNEKTIFTNLGGWNCRHAVVPVNKRFVTPEIIARVKAEGFIE